MTVIIEPSVIDWSFIFSALGGALCGTLVAIGFLWFVFRRYDS